MSDERDDIANPDPGDERVSRRDFLRYAGVGAAAGAVGAGVLGCATVGAETTAGGAKGPAFDREVDVVVVGGGGAGAIAAIIAADAGAEAVLLEKGLIFGGTTAKSGGVYWIPNNSFLKAKGIEEPRDATLREMARHSYPQLYNPADPKLGLPEHEYSLLTALYDNGPKAVERLAEIGALISQPAEVPFGPMPDYFDHSKEDKTPRDRRLWAKKPDGSFGLGDEMMRQLKAGLEKASVPILLGHRVTTVLRNAQGDVVGVEATKADKSTVRIRARRGVIFASGGFTQSRELMRNFQPGPIYGGCAVPTNEGDFVYMATAAGAKLGNMQSAWRAQIVLEQALQFSSTPDDVFMPPGDSMILVNRRGERVVNEKANYNERTNAHFYWDPTAHEWTNRFLFMVYDQRTAELYGGRFPIPAAGAFAPYVIKGESLDALAGAIDARVKKLGAKLGEYALDDAFKDRLKTTIARFNGFAGRGVDEDFRRGEMFYDRQWNLRIWSYPNQEKLGAWPLDKANTTMYPIRSEGPYYAIILAAGTLDTNGGPVINAQGEVLDAQDRPIPGLYGAGNCIASPAGRYYYGGGGTLGPAVTYAYLAGMAAAKAPIKTVG
ncbi:MAG: FAD-dependent oxidoreductase [Myxococcales bacterium]|nr:FAD-dependent oxidoreductase [Myxococcales bacterium]